MFCLIRRALLIILTLFCTFALGASKPAAKDDISAGVKSEAKEEEKGLKAVIEPPEAMVCEPAEEEKETTAGKSCLRDLKVEECSTENEITMSFAGDCTLGTDESFPYQKSFTHRLAMQNNDYAYFFKAVKPVFGSDDLTLVNLESPFTTPKRKAEK